MVYFDGKKSSSYTQTLIPNINKSPQALFEPLSIHHNTNGDVRCRPSLFAIKIDQETSSQLDAIQTTIIYILRGMNGYGKVEEILKKWMKYS